MSTSSAASQTRPAPASPQQEPARGFDGPSSPPPVSPLAAPPRRGRWLRSLALLIFFGSAASLAGWRYAHTAIDAPAELVLQGNIDVRQVNLSFKVGGRIDQLLADEGDLVQDGQLLATLDKRYFEDELRLARAQRDIAAANAERLNNGSRPEEIEQAQAMEAEAQAALQRAEKEYQRAERLIGKGAIAKQEFDATYAAVLEARARVRSAVAARRLADLGPRQEDRAAGRAQLDAAAAQLIVAQRRLEDSHLVAPHGGVILTRAREQGAIVAPGETVFTLTLSSPVWVRTYVGEPDLGSIQPGMDVTVITDAVSGRPYSGRVGFISPTAEFTPKSVETRELRTDLVYRLRIVVEDPDGGLRQGMPVTVSVKLPGTRRRSFKQRLLEALGLGQLGVGNSDGS